jgi:hypothetical protein
VSGAQPPKPPETGIYTPTMEEFARMERRLNPSPKQLEIQRKLQENSKKLSQTWADLKAAKERQQETLMKYEEASRFQRSEYEKLVLEPKRQYDQLLSDIKEAETDLEE